MKHEKVSYEIDGQSYSGYWAFPAGDEIADERRPAIIVAHAWMGQDHFALRKAEELAALGYIGFAADLYGDGKNAAGADEAWRLMMPLFEDRLLLQKRIRKAFDVVSGNPRVDPGKIGIIGFCFGGLMAIELLRSGAPVKGAVSFHGVLGNAIGECAAKRAPIANGIKGSLLMLHGVDDPLVSVDDILGLQRELSEAEVDWQMNIYSHTSHAFTNPQAHDTKNGLIYNSKSSDRAWWAMIHFFSECFGLERKLGSF